MTFDHAGCSVDERSHAQQQRDVGRSIPFDAWQTVHGLGGSQDRGIAGTAAQVAAELAMHLLDRRGLPVPQVVFIEADHNTGRAESALRSVLFDHRGLDRVQGRWMTNALDRHQQPAMHGTEREEACIDALPAYAVTRWRELTEQHQAGTAIAFGAAFLGACESPLFSKMLKQRVRIAFPRSVDNLTVMAVGNAVEMHMCRLLARLRYGM
jgi:hypothetical protein